MKMKSKTAIWTVVSVLLLAVILCGILTNGFLEWNRYCLFGHDYGADGKCTRCGKDKPAEEQPKPEPEQPAQPQASVMSAESFFGPGVTPGETTRFAATPESLSWADLTSGEFKDIFPPLSTRATYDSELNKSILIQLKNIDVNEEDIFITKDKTFQYHFGLKATDTVSYYHCRKKIGTNTWTRASGTGTKTENYIETVKEFGDYQIFFIRQEKTGTNTYSTTYSNFYTVHYGTFEELPAAPSKTGYTFTGWYTDEACTQLYTDEYVTSDITLYAGFTPITYTLNFVAQGGNGTMQQMQCTYDVEYTLPTCAFTYPNYRFVGWAIDDDSDEAEIGLTDGQKFSNLSEVDNYVIDLFAKWELDTVTVSFDVDGTVTPTTVTIGQAATLPDEPSKTGYIFLGWYTADGELYNNEAITADCTLTARFEIIRCTVTFMVDGQVYAVYVCDYGTSIKDALQGAGVNTALYKADKQSGNF